jgi:hypothetical protein
LKSRQNARLVNSIFWRALHAWDRYAGHNESSIPQRVHSGPILIAIGCAAPEEVDFIVAQIDAVNVGG